MTEFRKMAEEILSNISFEVGRQPSGTPIGLIASPIIIQALTQAHKRGQEKMRERCVEEIKSGYLYGDDCKNEDYACNKCGGDIRGHCCKWRYTHNGNEEIAEAIRNLNIEEE